MMTGSASLNAVVAALRSPLAIASSTLRTELRSSERRVLLIAGGFTGGTGIGHLSLVDDWRWQRDQPAKATVLLKEGKAATKLAATARLIVRPRPCVNAAKA